VISSVYSGAGAPGAIERRTAERMPSQPTTKSPSISLPSAKRATTEPASYSTAKRRLPNSTATPSASAASRSPLPSAPRLTVTIG
jgi:hypothetical protein